jgi:hypothetical protein
MTFVPKFIKLSQLIHNILGIKDTRTWWHMFSLQEQGKYLTFHILKIVNRQLFARFTCNHVSSLDVTLPFGTAGSDYSKHFSCFDCGSVLTGISLLVGTAQKWGILSMFPVPLPRLSLARRESKLTCTRCNQTHEIIVNKAALQLCKYLCCKQHSIYFPFMRSELKTNISVHMSIIT